MKSWIFRCKGVVPAVAKYACVLSLAGWAAEPQVVAQEQPPVAADETDRAYLIGEPTPPPVEAGDANPAPVDEDNAPQPVNLSSASDDDSVITIDHEFPIQKHTLTALQRSQFEAEAILHLDLLAATVQQIEAVEYRQVRKVALTLANKEQVLELYPHSMRSANFRIFEQDETGFMTEVAPPPITTYRGSVVGDISSLVVASIINGKLYATIETREDKWAVQPVGDHLAGASGDLHAVYRVSDVIPPAGVCGVEGAQAFSINAARGGGNGVQAASGGNTNGRTQIAWDTDNQYYLANGSSTQVTVSDIEMILNQVGEIFETEFSPSICYVNEGVIVRTSEPDPYSTSNSSDLLCQFRNEWNNNDPISSRDVAHMMTGRNLDAGTIGVAFVGVICNRANSTTNPSCSNNANIAYGLSQTFFSASITSRVGLTAHEIGHSYGACHCDNGGCPAATPNCCTGSPGTDADCGIMNSFAGALQNTLLFGSQSTTDILDHRSSRTCLSGCTSTVYVDLNNASSGSGTLANPYNSLTKGINWVKAGGTIKIFGADYPPPDPKSITKFLNLERQDGTVNIGD